MFNMFNVKDIIQILVSKHFAHGQPHCKFLDVIKWNIHKLSLIYEYFENRKNKKKSIFLKFFYKKNSMQNNIFKTVNNACNY